MQYNLGMQNWEACVRWEGVLGSVGAKYLLFLREERGGDVVEGVEGVCSVDTLVCEDDIC